MRKFYCGGVGGAGRSGGEMWQIWRAAAIVVILVKIYNSIFPSGRISLTG